MKILIVEDNPIDIENCKDILSNEEFSVTEIKVVSSAPVLEQYMYEVPKWQLPDIILLDIYLPGGTGIEILKKLKSETRGLESDKARIIEGIPVVIMSTSTDDEDIVNAFDFQADFYIEKPVRKKHLLRVWNGLKSKSIIA